MPKNNLNEINEQIRLIRKELGQVDFDKKFTGGLKESNAELSRLRRELLAINSDVDYFAKSLGDSIQELQKSNYALAVSKKSFKSLVNIAEDFTQVLGGQVTLTNKQIQQKKSLVKQEFKRLDIAAKSGMLEGAQLAEVKERVKQSEDFLKSIEKVEKFQTSINNQSGVKLFDGLNEISDAIPGLGKFTSMFQDASDAARQAATDSAVEEGLQSDIVAAKQDQRKLDKDALKSGKDLTIDAVKRMGLEDKLLGKNGKVLSGTAASKKATKMGIGDGDMKSITKSSKKGVTGMQSGIKSLGKSLLKSLGPLYLLKELVDAMKGVDAASSKMAKEFGMTYDDALGMNMEMTNMASASGELFVTTKGIRETFEGINSALGTSSMMSEDMAISFTKLRTMSGFTNEELQGIASLQLGTSKTTEDITGEFLAQARISATQNGVLLNEQKLLKEIGNISASTTLSLGKNPGLIAEAVATTKSLGMEMGKVDAIAGSLLDFESSIQNELQAELLLGRDINLEKARQFALNNDIAGVAREISEQMGDSAEFGELNRIQQEALAKSVGMSREDLASTLLMQDKLSGLTAKDAEAAQKKFETLRAQVGEAEAMRILEEKGVEGLNNQVGAQDKFNATIEKLKEVFVTVANAIMPIVSIISKLFGFVGAIMSFLDPMIQTVLVGVAAIEDLINGIGFLFGGEFGDSAIKAQIQAAEASAQTNYGFSGDAFGDDQSIKNRTPMAKGGIVTGPTNALVGEAGPEAVIPLNDNSPMIKQANKTNDLLEALLTQQTKQPQLSAVGLYEVQ